MKNFLAIIAYVGLSMLVTATDTIATNNAAFVGGLSPCNWYCNGSTSVITPNPGAYVKFNFTGTSLALNIDVSSMAGHGYSDTIYPVVLWKINGGLPQKSQLTSSTTALTLTTGLADTTHSAFVQLIGIDESGTMDRWTIPEACLTITGIVVDTSRTITQAALRNAGWYLAYGDSISEGAVVLAAAGVYAQVEDASLGYQQLIADALNVEYGNVAFAGQSWSGGVSNVPGLPTTFDHIFNGQSRTFSPAPNLVTINMGTNGSVSAGTVTTFLSSVRATVGAGCQIILIIPFGQFNVSALTTGFTDYQSANPTDIRVSKIDLGSTGSSLVSAHSHDGTHPDSLGQLLLEKACLSSVTFPLRAGTPISSF